MGGRFFCDIALNHLDKKKGLKQAKKSSMTVNTARSTSARDISGPLCQALRQWGKLNGTDVSALIAEIEAIAYAPDSANQTLPSIILDRCLPKRVIQAASTPVLLFLFAALTQPSFSEAAEKTDPRDEYQTALQATDRAERIRAFESAAVGFKSEIEKYPDSSELLADWGNAAIGASDLGEASLAFRRALAIDPGHERARRNLSWVEQQLPEWSRFDATSSPLTGLFFWSAWLTTGALLLLSGVTFSLFGLSILLYWRKNRVLIGVLGLVWLSMIGSFVAGVTSKDIAVVQQDAGPIRAADNVGAPPVTSEWMPPGSAVILLREHEQWSEVSTSNGLRGWLPNHALITVEE